MQVCGLYVFEEGNHLLHGSISRKGTSLLPLFWRGSSSHTFPSYSSPSWTKEERVDEGWAEMLTQCVLTSVWEICWRVWQRTFSYFYSLVTVSIVNNGGKLICCGRTVTSQNSWAVCYPGTNIGVLSAKHHEEVIIWVHICRNKSVDTKREIIIFWLFPSFLWLEVVMLGSLEHQPSSWDFNSSSVSFLSSGNHALVTCIDFHGFGALPHLRRNLYYARCCTNQSN